MHWVFFAFAQDLSSSCGKQGLLFVAGHGSRALGLSSCGTGVSVAHRHVESFQMRDLDGDPFFCMNFCPDELGGDLKPLKFERSMTTLRSSPRGAKESWS